MPSGTPGHLGLVQGEGVPVALGALHGKGQTICCKCLRRSSELQASGQFPNSQDDESDEFPVSRPGPGAQCACPQPGARGVQWRGSGESARWGKCGHGVRRRGPGLKLAGKQEVRAKFPGRFSASRVRVLQHSPGTQTCLPALPGWTWLIHAACAFHAAQLQGQDPGGCWGGGGRWQIRSSQPRAQQRPLPDSPHSRGRRYAAA